MTTIEAERIRGLVNSNKAVLIRMAVTSDEKPAYYYKGWTKGELVVHLLEHHWPED